jgi:hypothetical protein
VNSLNHLCLFQKKKLDSVAKEYVCKILFNFIRNLNSKCIFQDGADLPKIQMGNVVLANVSSLSLTSRISTISPFSILDDITNEFVSEILIDIKTGESKFLTINFDPSFKNDFHNEILNGLLTVNYIEHQHTVNIFIFFCV